MLRLILTALAFGMSAPAIAQTTGQQAPTPPPGSDALSDDPIIVEGLLDLKDGGVPAPSSRASNADPTQSVVANRIKFEFSDRIAKCVGRGKLAPSQRWRDVLDRPPNESRQVYAQDWLKRQYFTCGEGSYSVAPPPPPLLGYSIYDRGAMTIEALRRYASDLELTPAVTNDPAVQGRFNALEELRNRYRLPVDYKYFEVAVCMVRLQPRLSMRLVRTDGPPKLIGRIEATIVNNARACVGGAKRVYFDPTQFRMYIADAVYRWAVAARGVDSLIP